MSTKTTHLNLDKPEIGDIINTTITQQGSNLDIIDSSLFQKVSKGELFLNVKDSPYSAIGNGTANDTTALQNAINDANSKGIPVLIPKGTYNFTQLNLLTSVQIVGVGGATTLVHTGTGTAILNGNSSANLYNMRLEGFNLTLNANTTVGIDMSRISNSELVNIIITSGNSTGIGVLFDQGNTYSTYYNSLYDVHVLGVSGTLMGTGFKFMNSANSNRLFGCKANYCAIGVDINTDFNNNVSIIGCTFEQDTTGVNCNGDSCFISGSRFEHLTNGIIYGSTAQSNANVGNYYSSVTNAITDNNTSTTVMNQQFDFGYVKTHYLSHDANGGWATNMNMRNYELQNVGDMSLYNRTTDSATNGSIYMKNGALYFKDTSGTVHTINIT